MSQLVEDLKAAKALIDTPEKWTKGDEKRLVGGYNLLFGKPGLLSIRLVHVRCAIGAVKEAAADPLAAQRALIKETGAWPWQRTSVETFNDRDGTTHADIMALFDRAIAAAEATHPITQEQAREAL